MYDELIQRLWECASGECFNCSQYTPTTNASICQKELMTQAADAIEELLRKEKFHAFLWNVINPNDMQLYLEMYHSGDEKEDAG